VTGWSKDTQTKLKIIGLVPCLETEASQIRGRSGNHLTSMSNFFERCKPFENKSLLIHPLGDSFITAFGSKKQSSPATRHGGDWGERRYSSYSFSTSVLDVGEWSASRPSRALRRGKDPRYPLYRRLGGPQSRSRHRG
jgi:hypothetical protein